MITIQRAAAELQRITDRDEGELRRREGARPALDRLREASEALVYRIRGDHVDLLIGRKIGGVCLAPARDVAAVQAFVDRFYTEFGTVFSGSRLAENRLRVQRVRSAGTTLAELGQYVDGVPVVDACWTLIFDRQGYLTHVTGAPFDPARLTASVQPALDADRAIVLSLEHDSLTPHDVAARAQLVIEGRRNRLLWVVDLKGRRRPADSCSVRVDGHSGRVVGRDDRRDHGVVSIPITHYSHPDGVYDSSGSVATHSINVDTVVIAAPPKVPNPPPPETLYSMQRIGSGRSRIWNAKRPGGASDPPAFQRTVSTDRNYFIKQPGASTSYNIFNEQQTYFWAQTLKTAMDVWGREPNDYGHYPVDAARAVNVEIVVNGDASMEEPWGGTSVYHGFFIDDVPGDWFGGDPDDERPTVFLFNSAGNTNSPQFIGPEISSSYAIIAHEVGHFLSWQYGNFDGPSGTNLGRSLREGFSMVMSALLGKHHFGTALSYTESRNVTTGGDGLWSYAVIGQPALKYSDLDCDEDNGDGAYYLARPFVLAMWRLMNNLDVDGNPIWGSADSALANTADLILYAMYNFTADSTMTWDKLCLALTARVYERVEQGLEKEPINGYDAYCAVVNVFTAHGLLHECRNS